MRTPKCWLGLVLVGTALPASTARAQLPVCAPSAPVSRDASWSPDGSRIVFSSNRSGNYEIWSMRVSGDDVVRLTTTDAEDYYPVYSPDARRVAYTAFAGSKSMVAVVSAAGGESRYLTVPQDGAADPNWLPGGRLVFYSDRGGVRDFWTADFDGLGAEVLFRLDGEEVAPRPSPDGRRLAFATNRDGNWEVYTVNMDGTDLENLSRHPAWDGVPSWSPDGTMIAYYRRTLPVGGDPNAAQVSWATAELHVVPARGGPPRRLTHNQVRDQSPTWSPDGQTIAFTSCASGALEVWLMDADGSRPRQLTRTDRR